MALEIDCDYYYSYYCCYYYNHSTTVTDALELAFVFPFLTGMAPTHSYVLYDQNGGDKAAVILIAPACTGTIGK